MEGGFSKAFLIRKENGSEVIAKILYYIAGPPTLTIAGEVGALEYIRKHTSIPIPRVLTWYSNNSNTIGAEYIIIEKAAGLYLRTDIEQLNKPLNNKLDLSFYIRPSCDRGYNPNLSLDFDKGLCESPTVFNFNLWGFYYKARNAINIKERLPTLWYTDLYIGNIFVASNERLRINYDYKKGIFKVKLRDNFDTLDKDIKLAKAYKISTLLKDKLTYKAINVPRVFRELFLRYREVFEIGVLPLQGWVALGLDMDEKRTQNKELLTIYIKSVTREKSVEEARAI
ncbi:hypothetical protein N7530_006004 [Penicillium desertorum]|uniref:Altered inheritance of mitochondria protein 9, mitochondrial n=1 Tax=Penicillium desertorum TaxID=1303715 RepID=A0A9W9X145_9EURO|nr:hypothetical protein N7530_006004 [Penicillium desertorum]